ncbi:MAG: hypothetical protein ACOX5W_11340 [Bacillota bacterium]
MTELNLGLLLADEFIGKNYEGGDQKWFPFFVYICPGVVKMKINIIGKARGG